MIKDQLIKARCTATEKQYLMQYMKDNKYKSYIKQSYDN